MTAALTEARLWHGEAREAAATGNLQPWETALAAARHARDLVTQGEADASLVAQIDGELTALEREQAEEKAERRLLDDLEAIRGNRHERWDSEADRCRVRLEIPLIRNRSRPA